MNVIPKRSAFALAVFATLAVGGCTATASDPTASAPRPSETPAAPVIDPGPVQLSEEEAGPRYLDIVCPVNEGVAALNAAFDGAEEEFLAGGAPDPSAVRDAANGRIAVNRTALELIDDEYFTWPGVVAEQVPHIRSVYVSELSTLNTMANAASYEDAYYTPWSASTPEQESAGQAIRYELGLDADTVASCAGHEDGHERLVADRQTRDELLADAAPKG